MASAMNVLRALAALCVPALGLLSSRNDTFLSLVATQLEATLAQIPDPAMYPTQGACPGCPTWATGTRNSWVSGFLSGSLLNLYADAKRNGDPAAAQRWLSAAIVKNEALALNQDNTGTHDVGFMVFTSLGHEFLLTGNLTAKNITLRTASSLATRFIPSVGAIQSWGTYPPPNGQSEVIIDNMLNLELLWWAGQQGNQTFTDMAVSHADRMIHDVFQPFNPGCVWHMLTYDYASGALLNRSSVPQGLGLDTVWSRGQAWSTLGFIIAYRYTQQQRYLQAAQDSAECFMRLLPLCHDDNGLPCWDFNATSPKTFASDSSALAIATSGIIEIALASDASTRARYLAAARGYLDILLSPTVLFTPDKSNALLNNGTTSWPQFGIALPYGDYYLIDAMVRWDDLPPADQEAAVAAAASKQT